MKFSQKIVVASSGLLLCAIALLSVLQVNTVQGEVENLVEVSLSEMVSGVSNTITTEMESKRSLAKAVTEIIEIAPNDEERVKEILEKPTIKNGFLAVGLGYQRNGVTLDNDDDWEAGPDYDPRARPWFIGTKEKGTLFVTEPYVDAMSTKKVIISIATPVREHGEFIAGMFYDLELSALTEIVNSVSILNSGYLFIVTETGMTIAHPEVKNNGKNISNYLPQVKVEAGNQRFEMEGINYLAHFTKVPSENWYIGAIINEDIAFVAVDNMRNSSVLYGAIGVLLSILVLTALIRLFMRPLDELSAAIQDVASGQGDLTKRLDTNTDQEFAHLAKGFNTFTETLQKQIQQSKVIATKILHGTEMTVQGAAQSSEAMRCQLQELEQLASAMNEMVTTATEVAHNAQGAASAAQEADNAIQDGSLVVNDTTASINVLSARIDQAVEEVQGLESATANIETILKVINDIAGQTNLLALNAAIEAARAGESGRGFAVVADEVRTLAQRTQESTTEIRSMIEQLQAGANSVSVAMNESKSTAVDAVDKAQAADIALQRIRDAIQCITDVNVQIASAAEEQSLVVEEINMNTEKIKDLSTQVASAAENANHAMKAQTENVHEQDDILNKFIV